MKPQDIIWSDQHCGVHQATVDELEELMPDLKGLIATFPENVYDYIWDVKVHMLMPGQYPCIPNWHRDMVPRDETGKEDLSKVTPEYPMYLWLSSGPLTEFQLEDGHSYKIRSQTWTKFTQLDLHRGLPSSDFTWRGLIRATHKNLNISSPQVNNPFGRKSALRRHCQVYLDANNFSW
ncbi:hypothetical protein Q4E40_02755 [Pontibacter sp. BT731]|uniref:hypothetical protein n=1 Tax=Pontibacter coccineus TaxID=3063328 RepID=UPI0026E2F9DF|nr:hypothetical protein [Pontibacter sp. BT731]MDO6389033.1 hypothetical protein [Pontibacter sp. BT731]